MNKTLTIVLMSLICFMTFKEKGLQINDVDKLQTNTSVDSFFHKISEDHFSKFFLDTTLSYYTNQFKSIATTTGATSWVKADFDNNGYTDILLIEKHLEDSTDDNRLNICIMDSGENRFFIKRLSDFHLNAAIPVVKKFGSVPMILYYHYDDTDSVRFSLADKDTTPVKILTDTLIYKFGDFIDYNTHPHENTIRSISIKTSSAFGLDRTYSMKINDKGLAEYNFTIDSVGKIKYGVFKATIDNTHFDKLKQVINYIDFNRLNNVYTVLWTDDQTIYLTVEFKDGTIKSINDYGMIGSFGLRKLYTMMFNFSNTQKWQSVEK